MKKVNRQLRDDLRPEYDFASMKGGVRGKYARQYRAGTNIVLLDPELAKAFPTDAIVNEVLRAALGISKAALSGSGNPIARPMGGRRAAER